MAAVAVAAVTTRLGGGEKAEEELDDGSGSGGGSGGGREGGREGLGRLCRGVLVAAGNVERGWKTGWC